MCSTFPPLAALINLTSERNLCAPEFSPQGRFSCTLLPVAPAGVAIGNFHKGNAPGASQVSLRKAERAWCRVIDMLGAQKEGYTL